MKVECYGQIKILTLSDNSVRASIEIDLSRGLIDDLLDLKRRGQFRLVLEPFQPRLGETVMAALRKFAEDHPYVHFEIPPAGCPHPVDKRQETEVGQIVCTDCGTILNPQPDESPESPEAQARSHELNAEQEAADTQFDALAESSRNHRRGPAAEEQPAEAEAAPQPLRPV